MFIRPSTAARRRDRWVRAATIGALVLGPTSLALTPSVAIAATSPTSSAPSLADALKGPGANVTGASFVALPGGGTPHGTNDGLGSFPTQGPDFSILTSGDVDSADDPNSSGSTSTDLGGGPVHGDTSLDVSILKVDLSVPSTANCLTIDFQFFSEEYPEWVNTQYNDAFIAELDNNTWSTAGSTISAPDNFAFDPTNNVISINAAGNTSMTAANAAGTTYDGATPLLSAATPVGSGAHSVYLSIFDQGDHVLDSAVFLDNLRVGWVPDPETQCVPGAQPKNFGLTLDPASATKTAGDTHQVTATLTDLEASSPLAGGTVLFEASGANSAAGSDVTDGAGEATFSYTGGNVGLDNIGACYDANGSGSCDSDEVFASASVTWTNPPPTNDTGGPYSGDEGSSVALDASATDPGGDTLSHTWSYAPVSGVDAGATCSFADANALDTTVTCTDDGLYELTLSTSDDVNPTVTDTADLTIGNVAPEITGITTPAASHAVGTPVSLDATYLDPGSNDSHTATVDWGDSSTSTPAASGGSVSDSHTYSSAGIYTICVTVTDDDGGADNECAESYVVVNDPSAGFITGGGWIDAPAGSFPAEPSASGPVRFGFVSKYQKGATTPSGSTEIQFRAGGLNFHSSAYEWLVVAGSKANYQGSGTVNGESGYRFIVSAVDGGSSGPDRFRVKIWDANTDTVVFDNQIGTADETAVTTAISRGSIVIHK